MLLSNKVTKNSGFSRGLKGDRVSQAKANRNGALNEGRKSRGPKLGQSISQEKGRTQQRLLKQAGNTSLRGTRNPRIRLPGLKSHYCC